MIDRSIKSIPERNVKYPSIIKADYFNFSTINPILYNVMSHRYRVAFKDTLCGRRRGSSYYQNGFLRDQSSFRETTASGGGVGYDRVHSVSIITFLHQENESLFNKKK